MFRIGDRVRIVSYERGVSDKFLHSTGTVTKINEKQYYPYYIEFDKGSLKELARDMWWLEENLNHLEVDEVQQDEKYKCLRCGTEMEFIKEYRFDAEKADRGIFEAIFDIEENLLFLIYVCPKCRHTEFFYNGKITGIDFN